MPLAAGPYKHVAISDGMTAPFYALRFDKSGRSEGPATERHLVDDLAKSDYTDVFLFSHGWNNDWATALDRYDRFGEQFRQLRSTHQLDFGGRDYRPLLAGVFWPSTALVMPWEQGPDFAGESGDVAADAVDRSVLAEIAESVADDDLPRFYELTERETLGEDEARELVRIIASIYSGGDADINEDPARTADDMLAGWSMLETAIAGPELAAGPGDFGAVGAAGSGGPEAAGIFSALNPRNLVRGATVWKMKDRAGKVGSNGVSALLSRMLGATVGKSTRYHLIGHSYGARVLMAALLGQPRPVQSLLLLQPAVNHLCFADRLGSGEPGGFKKVLDLVDRPVMSTFSANDFALHRTFHLVLRRGGDVGEVDIAATEPPNQYAALGGYGPRGFAGWREVPIKDPTDRYDVGPGAPDVWAIHGTARIGDHGDVINAATAWALYNLVEVG